MNSIRLYFNYISINIRSQMQYRASFIMLTIGSFVVTFIEFLGLAVLFSRFGSLKGWRLEEVAMFYGLINLTFGFTDAFGRGFDIFANQVITGEFDRTLLRPRSTELQVLGHDLQLMRFGRVLEGLAILVWASVYLKIAWGPAKVLLLFFAFAGGVSVFTGLLIIQATMCFWSTQSLELMNSFTYGGIEAIQWPLPIFNKWFARLFIFVIPLACVNYFPVLAILEKPDALGSPAWFQWVSPLAGILFLIISLGVWNYGVRHYRSTGS